MLYYKFRNFGEFQELFGIQHHASGEKSRRNRILLSYIKNRRLLHNAVVPDDYSLLHISDMAELKKTMHHEIRGSGHNDDSLLYEIKIKDDIYHSALYYTDANYGLCEDGDFRSIRYINAENGRVFKMKIGKFFRKIILETIFGQTLPEQVLTYLCEEMTQDWQIHTMGCLPQNKLFVNKDFERIYDSSVCVGDFHSCMVNDGYHTFYEDAVEASAAYLENEDGQIIARCIIYNEVKDQNGKIWRLAERQYSKDENDVLKRALVDALIRKGHIDGYKSVGAGCGDSRAFVDNDGNSLSSYEFSIKCDLDYGDTLSYQDSFKNYSDYTRIATNFGKGDIELDTPDGHIADEDEDDEEYDDYHDYHCSEVTLVYKNGHEYYCDSNNLDDFVYLDGKDEYHHQDDVDRCEECEDDFLSGEGYYSDITEEYYCCSSCLEKAEKSYKEDNWTYSEYDDEYFENEDDVVEYQQWSSVFSRYDKSTITQETLDEKIEEGEFYIFDGVAYDKINDDTHLPYGMRLMPVTVGEAA